MQKTNLPIKRIVYHCSDSPHRGDRAADVHKWHKEKGWSGIGYHYVIDEFGRCEPGRPHYWKGAHVKGFNRHSIGIMLFGEDEFTKYQFNALARLTRQLISQHYKTLEEIVGHYQLDKNKTCPNFDVPQFLEERKIIIS